MADEENKFNAILDHLHELSKELEQDADEDTGIDTLYDNEEEIDSEESKRNTQYNLSAIPESEWKYIKVSNRSSFGDSIWDFSDYPSPLPDKILCNFSPNSSYIPNLTDPKNKNIQNLIKSIFFYRIPHNNTYGRIRSYNTLQADIRKIQRIIAFLINNDLYTYESNLTINNITEDAVTAHLETLKSNSMKWEFCYALRFWHHLSSQKLLPTKYTLNAPLVSDRTVSGFRKLADQESKPFEPIPLDEYARIFNYCGDMVEVFSKDILWLYDNFKHRIVGAIHNPERLGCRENVLIDSKSEIDRFNSYVPVSLENGQPWWSIKIAKNKISKEPALVLTDLTRTVVSLFDACCILLLCVTGMRRSECGSLADDCLSWDNGFWLTVTVFKTSEASQGDVKKIPIPDIAAKAIKILIELGADSRKYGNHRYLLARPSAMGFGNPPSSDVLEHTCRRVELVLEAEQRLTAHRFRKSLAMYMIHQDPRNLEVIRRLFSHSSLKMTLKYILSLPGVHDEIKKILIDENTEILAHVINSVINKSIGGVGGNRLRKAAENSSLLKAKLQDDGKESLSQYVSSILDEGIKLLHRTNLAVCLRTPGLTSASPCDPIQSAHDSKLHPNIWACDPYNCRYSVFTEENVSSIKQEIIFHDNLVSHPYCSEGQKSFSQQRINDAYKRLKEVIGEAAAAFMRQVSNG